MSVHTAERHASSRHPTGPEPGVILAGYADPYDLWGTPFGVSTREQFYRRKLGGKLAAGVVALADWLAPSVSRRALGCPRRAHPITIAQAVLLLDQTAAEDLRSLATPLLDALDEVASVRGKEWSWGLGFPWMSKNGLYGPEVPFVTHTPYVMEALLILAGSPDTTRRARRMFRGTWRFLERLRVMEEADDVLALSYAPVEEPRIVVNANAYAAFACALHAVDGDPEHRALALDRSSRLTRWVCRQQREDGAWRYYADDEPGNFVDGFHSGFVLKNLLKTLGLVGDLPGAGPVREAIERGWRFMRESLHDPESGLCRRFVERDLCDPYRWDLYDQAEMLGLLVDFGELEEATALRHRASTLFSRDGTWWCRVDAFGRRWGRGFLRWGIVPFLLASARLDRALGAREAPGNGAEKELR